MPLDLPFLFLFGGLSLGVLFVLGASLFTLDRRAVAIRIRRGR